MWRLARWWRRLCRQYHLAGWGLVGEVQSRRYWHRSYTRVDDGQ
jgi:hypothetical protein